MSDIINSYSTTPEEEGARDQEDRLQEDRLRESNPDITDPRDIQSEAEDARRFLYIHGFLSGAENVKVSRRIRGYILVNKKGKG